MQMGFNNDVTYRGLTVHIQTEDHGLASMKVTSQVFFSGAVLESKTISYAREIEGIDDPEERDERVRTFMKALHRKFFKRIQSGQYDDQLPLDSAEGSARGSASKSVDAALDVPRDLLEQDGFAIVSEDVPVEELAAKSRSAPLDPEEFEPSTLVDEMAAVAADMGHEGFVQMGGIGSGSHVAVSEEAVERATGSTEQGIVYGDTRAYRGVDAEFGDLGAMLLDALSGS